MTRKELVALFTAWLLGSLIQSAVAAKDTTDAGRASYSTRAPEGVKLPPDVIYRTDKLSGPVPTTDLVSGWFRPLRLRSIFSVPSAVLQPMTVSSRPSAEQQTFTPNSAAVAC